MHHISVGHVEADSCNSSWLSYETIFTQIETRNLSATQSNKRLQSCHTIQVHIKYIEVLLGTIIRGTPKTPKSQLVTPISTKLQRPDGRGPGQGSVHSRDTISSRPSPASGRNSRPRQIHASPEGLLKQQTHLRLARGPARAGFAEKQPWPDRYANRPYRRSIQCKDRLTSYPDARSSVDRAEVTAVTSPLH
jgi:hypothetical protein